MKGCQKFILASCLMLSAQTLNHAQEIKGGGAFDTTEAVRELYEAYRLYDEAYVNLRVSRGLEATEDPTRKFIRLGSGPLSGSAGDVAFDPVEVIRDSYPRGTGLLFYSRGENNHLRVWLITGEGIKAYHKATVSQEKLDAAISDLRNSLGVDSLQPLRQFRRRDSRATLGQTPKTSGVPLRRAVANLTEILLPGPVSRQLSSVRHLIVNPILGIGTVPFTILRPFASDEFLIDRVSISFAPSLYDLAQAGERWQPAFRRPLIVGNPYLPPDGEWAVPPLPGAEEEAQAIAKMIGGEPVVGKAATKEKVVAGAKEADFLYFGTHGVASSEDPLLGSFLTFSAPTLEAGFWTAKEIQSTKLKAQIAVLSACQTGLGQAHDAGVIGLARAFQIAGVPRVVMSLWKVDDAATAELMQSFGRHLRDNIPSEALRQAMLEVRKRRPDPSLWASFVLFGTPR